ncbi:hypothetical protein, partial [uncultured Gimesia sp.]|uniref:hypothetical protein n=1 Tax=uncultured Gimesia sp. TaxID=1678688 RepID=UPI0026166577
MTILRFTFLIVFTLTLFCLLPLDASAQNNNAASPPWAILKKAPDQNPLPGTKKLTDTSDLSSKMIAGIDRFLLKKISQAAMERAKVWSRDLSSPEAYTRSIASNRK